MKLEVGMYVRFKDKKSATYIRKLTKLANEYPQKLYGMEIDVEANYSPYLSSKNIIKASHNIIDLIEPMDLMFIDISPDDCGGIVVPRVAETEAELKKYKKDFASGWFVLKGVVTREQIENMTYKVV
jgi:hypothetical protein